MKTVKTPRVLIISLLIFFTTITVLFSQKTQKYEVTEVLSGAMTSISPCLNEMLIGDYYMHYTFWDNKWQLRIDAVMHGTDTGTEYHLGSFTNLQGHVSDNPSGREHNTGTFLLLLTRNGKLVAKINANHHITFLNGAIISDIDHLNVQCK